MLHRVHWLLVPALLLLVGAPSALQAQNKGDVVQFGRSIVVHEGEEAASVVCIGCSIRMMGDSGDVVAVGGGVSIDGTVRGDVVAVGGGVHLGENASISGDLVTVGGKLWRHPNATVKGTISSQSGAPVLLALVLVPLIPIALIIALIVWLVKPNRPRVPTRA